MFRRCPRGAPGGRDRGLRAPHRDSVPGHERQRRAASNGCPGDAGRRHHRGHESQLGMWLTIGNGSAAFAAEGALNDREVHLPTCGRPLTGTAQEPSDLAPSAQPPGNQTRQSTKPLTWRGFRRRGSDSNRRMTALQVTPVRCEDVRLAQTAQVDPAAIAPLQVEAHAPAEGADGLAVVRSGETAFRAAERGVAS